MGSGRIEIPEERPRGTIGKGATSLSVKGLTLKGSWGEADAWDRVTVPEEGQEEAIA